MKAAAMNIGVVAMATLLEAIRNKLLLVAVFFAIVLVGLSVTAASVSIGEHSRLIIDVGLAAASALGSVVALSLAITSFAGELRKHTAYPVLARPISRSAFVVGKYLGVLLAMLLVVTAMVLATACVVWLFGEPLPAAFWASLWMIWIEMALVVAIAIFFSTLTVPTLAATYTVGLVIAGNLAGEIHRLGTVIVIKKGQLFGRTLQFLYYALPDFEKLSLRGQAANSLPIPTDFMWIGTAYGLAYAAFALAAATWIFSRRRSL